MVTDLATKNRATNQKNSCLLATALIFESIGVFGAGDRNRTDTGSTPAGF